MLKKVRSQEKLKMLSPRKTKEEQGMWWNVWICLGLWRVDQDELTLTS
jgi:hypothetical protein